MTKVAESFKVDVSSIISSQGGRVTNNMPWWVALFLSQECCRLMLKAIASEFGLNRTESIATTLKNYGC
jgi:chromosomal replication initiation ATPase DnaA